MRRPVRSLAMMLVLGVAGCGAVHKAAPPTPPAPAPKVATPHAPQLVSMRRINGATWQTVVIRADGTGDVGIFIGEWAGTHHTNFRLGGRELGQLKHLVALATRIRRPPVANTSAASVQYIIYARRRVFETAQGMAPPELASLAGLLNGLIDRYS